MRDSKSEGTKKKELQLDVEHMDLNTIQDTLQRVNVQAGKQAEEALSVIMEGVLKKGISPKLALKIGDDTIEAIYAQAYNLYNQGKYKEASYIFRLLMLLDFTAPKHILGLAACMHRMKDYINAANMYFLCATLDPKNPMPHYHSVDCYLQVDAVPLALMSLDLAIKACIDQPQYKILKERAELLKSSLEQQMKEQPSTEKKAK
jgi:type III secretion system low calcium response chaperone LcrH/SycD